MTRPPHRHLEKNVLILQLYTSKYFGCLFENVSILKTEFISRKFSCRVQAVQWYQSFKTLEYSESTVTMVQ